MNTNKDKIAWASGGRQCELRIFGKPEFLLLQPADEHDWKLLDQEAEAIAGMTEAGFALGAFMVKDWNAELSPWEAPAVFGNENFGNGAGETLAFIEKTWIPEIFRRLQTADEEAGAGILDAAAEVPVIIGGYSLAGLFSLWSVYQTGRFAAAAAASPSVWFPCWVDFVEREESQASCIYLSLGDKEERARNQQMARVGACIRRQHEILRQKETVKACTLEWNPGNHFRDPDLRTAKGFAWCVNKLKTIGEPVGKGTER